MGENAGISGTNGRAKPIERDAMRFVVLTLGTSSDKGRNRVPRDGPPTWQYKNQRQPAWHYSSGSNMYRHVIHQMKDGGVPWRKREEVGSCTHQDDGFGVLAGSTIGLLTVRHLKHIGVICVQVASGKTRERRVGGDDRNGEG